MATVKLEQFLNDVMPEVPGCDTPIALYAIRSAAIEFCERTLIIRTKLDQDVLTAGIAEYDLAPPAGALVARVLSLRVNDKLVESRTEDQLDDWKITWRTAVGEPRYYTQLDPYQLIFAVVPDSAYTVDMTVATAPTVAATSVDKILYDKFREAIASGAKYRLKLMPGKPWSDQQGAIYYKSRFDFEIGGASIIAAKGFGRAPLRVSTSV